MKKRKLIKIIVGTISLSIVLFCIILYVGNTFINKFGPGELKINDIIIYTVYVVQIAVTAVLSWLVYDLSKNATERELKNDKINKINAFKYIKNEVNYNQSIVIVLEQRNINMNNISKRVLKMDAWDKYNVILIDLLTKEEYNKLLSYYATIQFHGTKELEKDIVTTAKETGDLMLMLDERIKHLEKDK